MFALTASSAIRGALRSATLTSALNPVWATCTFGWLPFAAHHAEMIGVAAAASELLMMNGPPV
jgi:hypothetical protein